MVHLPAFIPFGPATMAVGAVCRNLTIYLVAWWFFEWGWLDHIAAASILILGFVAETEGRGGRTPLGE